MSSAEKGEAAQSADQSVSGSDGGVGVVQYSWATRNGMNLESFKQKEIGANIELERPMKTRHLHMISIGTICHLQSLSVLDTALRLTAFRVQVVLLALVSSSVQVVRWLEVDRPVSSSISLSSV